MSAGQVVEQGTHDELLAQEGAYHKLVTAQNFSHDNEVAAEAEEEVIDAEEENLDLKMSLSRKQSVSTTTDIQLRRISTARSVTTAALQGLQTVETGKEYGLWALTRLIASFNNKEWQLMLLGLFWAVVCGGGNPTQALLFAKQITTLGRPISDDNSDQVKSDSDFWSSMYLMLGLVQLLAEFELRCKSTDAN